MQQQLTAITTITATFLYMEQGRIIDEAITDEAKRTETFALIDLLSNAATLLLQAFLTARLVRWFGVGITLAILPTVVLLGFVGLWLAPVVAMIVVFQVARRGLHYAVARPVREMLFAPLGPDAKYKSKAFIDTFIYRGGDQLAAWVPKWLALIAVPLAWVAIPAAFVWAIVGIILARMETRLEPGREPRAVPPVGLGFESPTGAAGQRRPIRPACATVVSTVRWWCRGVDSEEHETWSRGRGARLTEPWHTGWIGSPRTRTYARGSDGVATSPAVSPLRHWPQFGHRTRSPYCSGSPTSESPQPQHRGLDLDGPPIRTLVAGSSTTHPHSGHRTVQSSSILSPCREYEQPGQVAGSTSLVRGPTRHAAPHWSQTVSWLAATSVRGSWAAHAGQRPRLSMVTRRAADLLSAMLSTRSGTRETTSHAPSTTKPLPSRPDPPGHPISQSSMATASRRSGIRTARRRQAPAANTSMSRPGSRQCTVPLSQSKPAITRPPNATPTTLTQTRDTFGAAGGGSSLGLAAHGHSMPRSSRMVGLGGPIPMR